MSLTLRRFFSVSGLTLLSRATGFLNIVLLGAVLGLSVESDAYWVANVLPNIIYEIVLGGLMSSVFLPLFARRRAVMEQIEYRREAIGLCKTLLFWLLVLSILASTAAPVAVRSMLLQAESAETVRLAEWFFRVFAFQIFFYALSALCSALLNAERRFTIAAAAPIVNNLVVGATLVAVYFLGTGRTGLVVLTLGVTSGVAAMALVQLTGLMLQGWNWREGRIRVWHPIMGKALRLGAPIVGLVVLQQFGLAVRSNLASSIEGGFTALQNVFRFFQLPYGILAVTIATLVVPGLAHVSARGEKARLRATARDAFRWTCAIMLPVAILYAAGSHLVMRLFMSHGELDLHDAALMGDLLVYYALGVFAYSIMMLIVRIFYAMENTRTPVMLLASSTLLNIALCLILFPFAGLHGIALAAQIGYSFGAGWGLMLLRAHLVS